MIDVNQIRQLRPQEGDVFVFSSDTPFETANEFGEALHLALPGIRCLIILGELEQLDRAMLSTEHAESSWLGWAHA
jgi:hypothetical protein